MMFDVPAHHLLVLNWFSMSLASIRAVAKPLAVTASASWNTGCWCCTSPMDDAALVQIPQETLCVTFPLLYSCGCSGCRQVSLALQ